MFNSIGGTNFTTFEGDLSSLVYGKFMFGECKKLKTFNANLDNLENGEWMFGPYSRYLTSFNGGLKSLRDGSYMFTACRLNKESVKSIIKELQERNTLTDSSYLGLGIDYTLQHDSEIIELLKPDTSGRCKIKSSKGGTWIIDISWN